MSGRAGPPTGPGPAPGSGLAGRSRRARLVRWFGARWRGEAPLGAVFLDDMLLLGTGVNVATTLAAMALVAGGAPGALAAVTFFLPVPFNLFLLVAVWRSAEPAPDGVATAARIAAVLWFIAASTL